MVSKVEEDGDVVEVKTENTVNVSDEDDEICEVEHLRKLFIGGLAAETTDENLRKFYSKWGKVVDSVVMRDPVTKRSRGFGFVTFTKIAMVDKAQASRPHIIDGKKVESKRALPRTEQSTKDTTKKNHSVKKLFIGGLKDDHDEKCLKDYFSQYGNVVSVEFLIDNTTGKRRGFALVEYDDYDAVDKAILQTTHVVKNILIDVKKSVYTKDEPKKKLGEKENSRTADKPLGSRPDVKNGIGYSNNNTNNSVRPPVPPNQYPPPRGYPPMNRPPLPTQPPAQYQQMPPYQQVPPPSYNQWGPPPQHPPVGQHAPPPPLPPNNAYGPPTGPPPMPHHPQQYPQQMPPQNYGNYPQNPVPPPVPPMAAQPPNWNNYPPPTAAGGGGGGNNWNNCPPPQAPLPNGPPPPTAPNWQNNQWSGNQQPPVASAPTPRPPVGPQPTNWQQPPPMHNSCPPPLPPHQQQQPQSQANIYPQQQAPPPPAAANNFGSGYQQSYGGGPTKHQNMYSNRMNPYNVQHNNQYNNPPAQGYPQNAMPNGSKYRR